MVNMLKTYENYEIALVSRNDCKSACGILWMVKENCSAFFKAADINTQKNISSDSGKSVINALVTEKDVISAVQ